MSAEEAVFAQLRARLEAQLGDEGGILPLPVLEAPEADGHHLQPPVLRHARAAQAFVGRVAGQQRFQKRDLPGQAFLHQSDVAALLEAIHTGGQHGAELVHHQLPWRAGHQQEAHQQHAKGNPFQAGVRYGDAIWKPGGAGSPRDHEPPPYS